MGIEVKRIRIGNCDFKGEETACGLILAKKIDNFENTGFKEKEGEIERVNSLFFVGGNGIKEEQARGISKRLGMEGPIAITGISGEFEKEITDYLRLRNDIELIDIPGLVSMAKMYEAMREGNFNLQNYVNTFFYTNDAMRLVTDNYNHQLLMGKPKNEREAEEQMRMISGNTTIDIVGSTLIDEYGEMKTITALIINKFHQIPEKIIKSVAQDPKCLQVAGAISILTSTGFLSGIEVMRNDVPTEIWVKVLGEDKIPKLFGRLKSRIRCSTKQLLNIILGGGYPLGLFIEEQNEIRVGEKRKF